MTDEQQSGFGCLVILLVIGGCYLYSSNKLEKADAARMMDDFVQKTQAEARDKIARLTEEYEQQKAARECRYQAEASKLLKQIDVERRTAENARTIQKEREAKQDELRSFALKEAPVVWNTIQMLTAERDLIGDRIIKVKNLLVRFNKDVETDDDMFRLVELKRSIEEQLATVTGKLEAAYIAAKKYEAMPQSQEFEDMMRKSIEEGISAAEAAEKRYEELKGKE